MPRDPRLYMTFPIDFHRHPKLQKLPADVRWTFVEMNGEARIADNDGRFSAEDAEFMWPIAHLDALVSSHPTRPLVEREHNGGDYVIRDYAEHQQTRAERDDLRAKRAEAGRKGGLAKSKASASRVPGPTEQTEAESESESEDLSKTSTSQSSSNRARVSTDAEVSPMTKRLAGLAGITSLQSVIDSARKHTRRTISADGAYQLAVHLIGKAKTHPRNPQMYVTRSISLSPFEVQQFIDEHALAVTA